jgi:hypothetical protein
MQPLPQIDDFLPDPQARSIVDAAKAATGRLHTDGTNGSKAFPKDQIDAINHTIEYFDKQEGATAARASEAQPRVIRAACAFLLLRNLKQRANESTAIVQYELDLYKTLGQALESHGIPVAAICDAIFAEAGNNPDALVRAVQQVTAPK